MSNIIDNSGQASGTNVRVGQASGRIDQVQRSAEPQPAGRTQGQHVQFSDSVALLQRAHDKIAAEPVVDSDRVTAARQAIADGSYQVDYDNIASALIATDKQLP